MGRFVGSSSQPTKKKEQKKSPWRDSNPQLSDPKSDALSIAPQGRVTLRYSAVLYMYAPQVPMELNCIYTALLLNTFGYDHINCNPPVLIRTPKLTQFEPAQYWGGGPPGNSAVLYPYFFIIIISTGVGDHPGTVQCCIHTLFYYPFCSCSFSG